MAEVHVGRRNNPTVPGDELDDLFDFDVPTDIFKDVDTDMDVPRSAKAPLLDAGKGNGGGLGVDEEIKVNKKRAPVAKLDEDRLLSPVGIPKLRKITRERLKFKGKGHEFSDVARLLNVYQFWLDDLYPRAKFADGLAMIEKLGHKKRLQITRKEWINEGKLKDRFNDAELASKIPERYQPFSSSAQQPASRDDTERTPTSAVHGWNDNDLNLQQKSARESNKRQSRVVSADSLFVSDDEAGNDAPPEDDLDALLAEDERKAKATKNVQQRQDNRGEQIDDNFDDELEAMAVLDDVW